MLGLPKMGSFLKFFFKEGRKSVELLSGPFCLNRALCVTPSTQRGSVQAELAERLLIQDLHPSCRFAGVELREGTAAPWWEEGLGLFLKRSRGRSASLALVAVSQ